MTTLQLDASMFAESNPTTLEPNAELVRLLKEALWSGPGFLRLQGLDAFFRTAGLTHFDGEMPTDGEHLPNSTVFLQNWMQAAYLLFRSQSERTPAVRRQYLAFDGFGNNRGENFDRGYAGYGGATGFFRSARVGVDRFLQRLQQAALGFGVTIDKRNAYKRAIVGTQFGSTKRAHFDALSEVIALQKCTANVLGGESVLYNVGKFCADHGRKPWDFLVPYSPDPAKVPPLDVRPNFRPFVAIVPEPDVAAELEANYAMVIPNDGRDDTILFTNGMEFGPDGSVYAFAHGAMPVNAQGAGPPMRNLLLSYITDRLVA